MYSSKTPLTAEYVVLIAVGIFVNLSISLWAIFSWPNYALLTIIFVPLIVTPIYSLIASTYSLEKEIISPIFIMIFNAFAAVALDAMIYRDSPASELWSTLFPVIMMYFFWIGFSSYFHSLIRFLIGSYGKSESVEQNLISFETGMRPEDIVFEIKKKKWFGLLCGMSIYENKSRNGKVMLRLKKSGTNLYLGIYGQASKDGLTVLNIIPYCIYENLKRKDILSDTEIKEFLTPQIEQIQKKLGLTKWEKKQTNVTSSPLVPETIEYIMYPAHVPVEALREHKTEVIVIIIVGILIMLLTSLKVANFISDTVFAGFSGVLVAIAIAIIGYRLRK